VKKWRTCLALLDNKDCAEFDPPDTAATAGETMRRKLGVTLVAGLAAAAVSGPAFGATLVVDAANPELECPAADFASINAAVAAASPGDRITVCPGLYPESVTAAQTLTFDGQGPEPRRRSGDPTTETVLRYSFVGFDVLAPGVVIEGFTIEGAVPGIGIRTSPLFSGYRIERNYLHRSNTDLTLQSQGSEQTLVRGNAFNNETDTATSASRVGISNFFGEAGALANVRIEDNLLTKHFADAPSIPTAITLRGASGLSIAHNDLVDGGEMLLTLGVDLSVENNRLSGSATSGIRVFESTRVRLLHNHVESSQGPGLLVGDAVAGGDVVVAFNRSVGNTDGISLVRSRGVLVAHNQATGNSVRGFRAAFGGGNTLLGNFASANALHGIHVFLEDGTSALSNVLRQNDGDGILLTGSTNGFVSRNVSLGNGEHDCHDDLIGAGTAGTANLWSGNVGRTESPAGLCTLGD
jgi:nitrous oxidase accessory protein NosD